MKYNFFVLFLSLIIPFGIVFSPISAQHSAAQAEGKVAGLKIGPSGDTIGGVKGGGNDVVLFDPINKSIEEIFIAILDIILVFAIPIILFFIIWAGFLYVTAQGSEDQVKKATTALTYAIVGGLIVLGAKVLLAVITNTIKLFA